MLLNSYMLLYMKKIWQTSKIKTGMEDGGWVEYQIDKITLAKVCVCVWGGGGKGGRVTLKGYLRTQGGRGLGHKVPTF